MVSASNLQQKKMQVNTFLKIKSFFVLNIWKFENWTKLHFQPRMKKKPVALHRFFYCMQQIFNPFNEFCLRTGKVVKHD